VPSRFQSELPDDLEAGLALFSSRLKIAALRSLLSDGPATGSALARRLRVGRSSLHHHLASLEELGVLVTDPPQSEPGPITRSYAVNEDRLRQLLDGIAANLAQGM
jgi:DNA-binding transcriptional ArsR family regulator